MTTVLAVSLDDRSGRIDHHGARPMYDQVATDIAADITSGALAPGARLPTEIELAAQYQVSRVTIRRAVKELSGRGLIVVSHGRGTFVTEREAPRWP